MAKRKVTWYIDEDVLRATRVAAARRGKSDSEIVEEALRRESWAGIAEEASRRAGIDSETAMTIAYEELHSMRSADGR
jgi:hypothetical protein